jgi:hypothetical protein
MLPLAREHIFMLYCNEQATTTTFFLSCHEEANNNTNNLNIRRSEELRYDYETQQSIFYMLLIARSDNNEYIFMSYCERSKDCYIFDVARSGHIASATKIS